jgi:serine/threonine-protein kinase CHEK2
MTFELGEKVKPEFAHRPIIMKSFGRNGVYVNDIKLKMGEKRILQNGDCIGLSRNLRFFCFNYKTVISSKLPKISFFKNYFISDLLGSGGCGEVRLCYKVSPKKKFDESQEDFETFAVKIIRTQTKGPFQTNSMEKIMSEVNVMKKLNNPHVLELIDYCKYESTLIIFVPFMRGGDLLGRIAKSPGRKLNEADGKFFILQLLLGLEYMHNKDITHRDIKCDNILLSDNGPSPLLKISDFGLSKTLNVDLNTICGTKQYAAPEILNNEDQYTNKVDIWSTGVVLYACLSGCMPFHENNNKNISLNNQIINGNYTFPENSFADVSADAMRFIECMLQVNPDMRQSASRLLRKRWVNDSANKARLQQLYESVSLEEDENDKTLTDGIEKTLENVAIEEDDPETKQKPAKRPRLMVL